MEQTTTAPTPAPGGSHYRRHFRNYLLDARMQLRYASYLVAIALALSGFLGWRLWKAFREASRLVALGDPVADEAIGRMMAREDLVRMGWLAAGLAAVLLTLLAFALVTTHKVAGPALVLGRTCRKVGEGKLIHPRPLRHGDMLTRLAAEVAGMIDALRAREERERSTILEASAALGGGAEAEERARQALARLAAEKAERLAP
jgi:HAMP domain-containing protein